MLHWKSCSYTVSVCHQNFTFQTTVTTTLSLSYLDKKFDIRVSVLTNFSGHDAWLCCHLVSLVGIFVCFLNYSPFLILGGLHPPEKKRWKRIQVSSLRLSSLCWKWSLTCFLVPDSRSPPPFGRVKVCLWLCLRPAGEAENRSRWQVEPCALIWTQMESRAISHWHKEENRCRSSIPGGGAPSLSSHRCSQTALSHTSLPSPPPLSVSRLNGMMFVSLFGSFWAREQQYSYLMRVHVFWPFRLYLITSRRPGEDSSLNYSCLALVLRQELAFIYGKKKKKGAYVGQQK